MGVSPASSRARRLSSWSARLWSAPLAAVLAVSSSACLAHTQPRPSERIQVLDAVGVRTFAKEGKIVDDGLLGGGLYEIVKEDPAAADQAAAHRTDITWSVGVAGAGIASAAAGVGLVATSDRDLRTAGAVALVAAGLSTIPIAILRLTADTHMWNAINAYNEVVEARLSPATAVDAGSKPGRPRGAHHAKAPRAPSKASTGAAPTKAPPAKAPATKPGG